MSTQDQDRPTAWVQFENGAATLRRLIAPGNVRGLILNIADDEAGAKIANLAAEYGFVNLPAKGLMRKFFDVTAQIRVSDIAKALGGNVVALPRSELLGDKWTVNLSARAPSLIPIRQPDEIIPDPKDMRLIGLNQRGEEVIRDTKGRYFRKVNSENGVSGFVHETSGDKPSLFLRAARAEDLENIASALVVMASKGTLHMADFNRVVDAALEEGPHGQLGLAKREASEIVRQHMMREITAIAVDDEASREKFVAALRISSFSAFVLSRPSVANAALSPSPAMASFIRRQTRGQSSVDFRGSDDMRIAIPRIIRDTGAFQLHDLAGVSADGMAGYTMNVLARREASGRTIIRVPEGLDRNEIERMRSEIGINYALEGVAEIASAVAEGVQDGHPSILFFIGERRPTPLDALPVAAMRTFDVQTTEDLINLERDIVRARGKIREFHNGVEGDRNDKPDDREENIRQKPYQPLSKAKEPFTMIPVALEGATRKALERVRRDMEERGGVDAVVANALGVSIDGLGDILTAEQVDAVAMRLNAADRGRAFLLADQTGVGKGRSLAAMALAHIRSGPNKKVLYFTESGAINAPDVYRDLKDVGAVPHISPTFLTTGSHVEDTVIDQETGVEMAIELNSAAPAARAALIGREAWPDGANIIITTYSQFRGKDTDASTLWLENALDGDTLLILDEAHNALNERSLQGENIRKAMKSVINEAGWANVIDGTATPLRDPAGTSLYKPLMPFTAAEGLLDGLLTNIKSGGEVAQETFATMLAEDGVFLRRDHDLSNVEFRVSLPDDALMLKYQGIMNKFSPVVEMMIECSSQIGEHQGRRQALEFQAMRARGVPENVARAQSNEMNQYSIALGSPLANLARITMNAIKIDQVVDESLQEIQEGRKPLITFHSTNSALFDEISKAEGGVRTEEAMENASGLTLKDQIRRIHNSMYRIKIDGEVVDARDIYLNVMETSRIIEARISDLPDDLPVSPVDALIERLEQHGVSVGEISGRTIGYRNNRIFRRTAEDRNKKRIIDRFNSGELDVLVYNSAGATGGSYHASPKFADQRPRTMIELEAPLDVIKYVQGQGRGNRYGQVANPRVKSVMTGLTPEMRILQQRNKKLRSLGASVDGNRSHPMLLDDIPDLLNKVGDEATRNVLLSMPGLARRLGFPEFAEDTANNRRANDDNDNGSGANMNAIDSLSNKVLARSIMLTAADQNDLVQRIRMEFDALIEELESRNANPLRPKELEGQIDIKATAIYSGLESEEGDLDVSAFLSPLYISTGIHHFNEEAWNGDKLITEIEATRRLYGGEGFTPYAERITQNLPHLMRPYLPEGIDMADALQTPGNAGTRFSGRHKRITDHAWILENLRPGVGIRYPDSTDIDGLVTRTIVGLIPPANPDHYDIPSGYKVKMIAPGMSKPETVSVSRLMQCDPTRIFFRPGLSENFDEAYLEEFNRESIMTRRLPVQILSGNLLQAINEAAQHDLGTVSLYRDMSGHVHRGIVVAKNKVDLSKLPASVPNGPIARELASRFLEDDDLVEKQAVLRLWGSMEEGKPIPAEKQDAEAYIAITRKTINVELVPLRKSTEGFYRSRPGLYEAMHGKPLPASKDVPARAFRRVGANSQHSVKFQLSTEENRARALRILELIGDTPMLVDGPFRSAVNDVQVNFDKIIREREALLPAILAADDEDGEIKTSIHPAQAEDEIDTFEDIDQTEWSVE